LSVCELATIVPGTLLPSFKWTKACGPPTGLGASTGAAAGLGASALSFFVHEKRNRTHANTRNEIRDFMNSPPCCQGLMETAGLDFHLRSQYTAGGKPFLGPSVFRRLLPPFCHGAGPVTALTPFNRPGSWTSAGTSAGAAD